MDLVFKILKDSKFSKYDSLNIKGYVIAKGINVLGMNICGIERRTEEARKGIALIMGIHPDLVVSTTFSDVLGYQSAGYAQQKADLPSTSGKYSIIESNGKIPKTRPGRKAVKMSATELGNKLKALLDKPDKHYLGAAIRELVYNNSKVSKDLEKIQFDFENIEIELNNDTGKTLLGLHTLDNGFSFVGCYGGGDWEAPVYFIIYHDGKSFRAYIPNNGNVYNPYTKCAFGNEEHEDEDMRWFREMFPGKYDNAKFFSPEWTDIEDVNFDWNVLRQEIETRIIVK